MRRVFDEDGDLLGLGRSRQEVLSTEAQANVAEVADVDRTAELLIWVFQSLMVGSCAVRSTTHAPAYGALGHHGSFPLI